MRKLTSLLVIACGLSTHFALAQSTDKEKDIRARLKAAVSLMDDG